MKGGGWTRNAGDMKGGSVGVLVVWEGERLELLVVQFVVAYVIHEVTCYTCRGRCTCPVVTPTSRTNK